MATTLEFSGSHIDDDDKKRNARRLLFHPKPQSAESYHTPTDQHVLAGPPLHELVEKHDDDDDDEKENDTSFTLRRKEEKSREPEPAESTESPFVEVPLREVNVPPQEFVEPLPLSAIDGAAAPEAAQAEHDNDEEDESVQPSSSRVHPNPPMRDGTLAQHMQRLAETAAETPAPVAPESVVLAAAEQNVESVETAEAQVREALAFASANPANPNVAPPNHNVLPPAPTAPPNAHAGGNFVPPVPPNHGGGGGGFNGGNFNNLPPNNGGPNYNYNPAPHGSNANIMTAPNFATSANAITNVVERTHTVERGSGNLIAGLALVGLLFERSKRKGGDAALEKKGKEFDKRLKAQGEVLQRQSETINKQHHELNDAKAHTAELEQHATERQRVAEAFGAATIASNEAARTTTPAAERRTTAPSATAERPAAERTATKTPESADEQSPLALEPEQRIRFDAWRGTVMRKDSAGREVVDTSVNYGEAYHQERQSETRPHAPRDSQVPSGGVSQPTASIAPIGVPLPGAFNPSLPAGMTNPALPANERSVYSDSQYLLAAPEHRVRGAATTVLLWLFVAVMAFAIVSGVRLFF